MQYRYLIGTPEDGPFAGPLKAESEQAARAEVERGNGPVLDLVDWTSEDGQPIDLFIVAR